MPGIGHRARSDPEAAAIVGVGSSITFAELDRRQRLLAGALLAEGIRRGDRVGILSANRPEYLEVTTGLLRAGIVPVPINALLTASEASYVIEDAGASWLFTDRGLNRSQDCNVSSPSATRTSGSFTTRLPPRSPISP